MADPKSDPRTDRHPDDGTPGTYPDPPDNSKPQPAPGGAGTGTKGDPGNEPDPTRKES